MRENSKTKPKIANLKIDLKKGGFSLRVLKKEVKTIRKGKERIRKKKTLVKICIT